MQAREAKGGVEMISSEGELRARLGFTWVETSITHEIENIARGLGLSVRAFCAIWL